MQVNLSELLKIKGYTVKELLKQIKSLSSLGKPVIPVYIRGDDYLYKKADILAVDIEELAGFELYLGSDSLGNSYIFTKRRHLSRDYGIKARWNRSEYYKDIDNWKREK